MSEHGRSVVRYFERDLEWRPLIRQLGRVTFGDRIGLALWLGLVVALGLTWRVGFFITDSYAIANALVNVADGHLALTRIQYSLSLGSQPGLHESGGRLYARNYGQVFLALPIVWALQAASLVGPLHLVVAGGWSLAILALARHVSVITDRPTLRGVGAAVALGVFAVNALVGSPLHPDLLHLVALQLSTVFAAAFGGVLFYRLVRVFHEQRVAIAAGVASVIAFPIGFWASIPKRHVLVAALLIGSVYCFARSRQAEGRREYLALASAYTFASLIAWIHAFEGLFALAALGSVDLLTGGIRDRKRWVAVVCGLVVGLAPMFLTNVLIAGNPLEPPRMLPNQGSGNIELAPTGEARSADGGGGSAAGGNSDPMGFGDNSTDESGSSGGGSGSDGKSSGGSSGSDSESSGGGNPLAFLAPVLGPLFRAYDKVGFILGFVFTTVERGVGVLGDPERLWYIYGRSGRIPGLRHGINNYEMIDLTVLESAPLLGGLVALPAVVLRSILDRSRTSWFSVPWRWSPRRQTDLLVVTLGILLTVVYLPRLPLFSMITVRYILYTLPLLLYGVVRLPPVREAVTTTPKRLGVAYGLSAVGGTAGLVLVLALLNVAIGEAMQFHALLNLGTAGAVALLVSGRSLAPERVRAEWVATGLGVTAGATTAFLVLAGVEYFQYGPFAVGIAQWLSTAIPIL